MTRLELLTRIINLSDDEFSEYVKILKYIESGRKKDEEPEQKMAVIVEIGTPACVEKKEEGGIINKFKEVDEDEFFK